MKGNTIVTKASSSEVTVPPAAEDELLGPSLTLKQLTFRSTLFFGAHYPHEGEGTGRT